MLGKMATGVRPAWTIHRQDGSQIPLETEAARRFLRRGNVAEALLRGGAGPAPVAGDLALSHEELPAAAGKAASRRQQAGEGAFRPADRRAARFSSTHPVRRAGQRARYSITATSSPRRAAWLRPGDGAPWTGWCWRCRCFTFTAWRSRSTVRWSPAAA